MSKSNTESSSAAQSSNKQSNSGMVITGGLDTTDQTDETAEEPEVEAEATEVPEEVEPEQNVEEDAEDADAVETDAEPEVGSEDENGEDDSEATESVEEEVESPEADTEQDEDDAVDEEAAEASSVEAEAEESAVDADDGQPESDPEVDATEATEPADAEAEEEADVEDDHDDEADTEEVDVAEVSHPPQRLNATIEAKELKNHLNNVSVLVEECKIRTSPEAMTIRAVDPANVGMVDATLDAEAFEGFDTDYGVLGVSLDRLEEVVSLAGAKDLVTFEYDTQTRKLHIKIDGIEYTLALIDPDSIRQEPDIPDLPLPCEVKVDSGEINRAVKAADMVSDHIGFRTVQQHRDDELVIEAEGDTDDVDLTLDEDDLVSASITDEVTSLFSLEYLKDINKALPSKTVVTIELGNEFPIKLRFSNENSTREVEYMLAPRINSD